ncbi:MAG: hypothetical protein ACOCQD_05120 [archaeon]
MPDIKLSEKYILKICPDLSESSMKIYNVLLLLRKKRQNKFVEITDKELGKLTCLSYTGINYAIRQLDSIGLIQVIRTKNFRQGKAPTEYIVHTFEELSI